MTVPDGYDTGRGKQMSLAAIIGSDPDVSACRTKRVTEKFSRCLGNNEKCKYSLPSGNIVYCVHPRHLDFRCS